ncbi:MAG: hypothetical protein ACJAR2_002716 [Ilumatobacter sp.]|jgi:hypothetical protein
MDVAVEYDEEFGLPANVKGTCDPTRSDDCGFA